MLKNIPSKRSSAIVLRAAIHGSAVKEGWNAYNDELLLG
jgi:hypothetical protein